MSIYFNKLRGFLLLLMLLQAGCNTTFKADQVEALLWATKKGSIKEVEALIAQGVDVNAQNSSGQRALHMASKKGHTDIVKLLLAQPGIDVNASAYLSRYRGTNDLGTTALHEAAYEGHADIVKLLLTHPGIDLSLKGSSSEDSHAKAWPATVRIRSEKGRGSGVIIDPQGYVITNSHVIPRSKNPTLEVDTFSGSYTAALVHRDKSKDLALLKLQKVKKPLPHLPLGDSNKLKKLDTVWALGHPLGKPEFRFCCGWIRKIGKTISYYAKTAPGMSGGPVLDDYGNLIGIHRASKLSIGLRYATPEGVGYAIPSNEVKSFLRESKITFPIVSSETEQLQEKLLEKVRHATVRIRVFTYTRTLRGFKLLRRFGSGVIIDPRGYVITNSHVIPKSARTVEFITDAGEAHFAEIVSRDKAHDLVLLKADKWRTTAAFPHLEFGNLAKLKNGDQVFALGYPGGAPVCVCKLGKCTLEANLIKHDAELGPKMDGGPLVDGEGRLIGIHKSRKKNKSRFWSFGKHATKNVAISAKVAKEIFEKNTCPILPGEEDIMY